MNLLQLHIQYDQQVYHWISLVRGAGWPEYVFPLQVGLARLERRKRWETKERQAAFDNLEVYQEKARTKRFGMWEYGDIQSDDEDMGPPIRKGGAGGRR